MAAPSSQFATGEPLRQSEDAGATKGEVQPQSEKDRALVTEVDAKFERWLSDRKDHEISWFIVDAFDRGQQFVVWDNQYHTLRDIQAPLPAHKRKTAYNIMFPKLRARHAKFVRGRPFPMVAPATNERRDKLDARYSQLALHYQWRKQGLEQKYENALLWAKPCGKGYWWFNWKQDELARMQLTSKLGTKQTVEVPLGDLDVSVGSAFEVLVADTTIGWIGDQPEIMRVRMLDVEEERVRHPKFAKLIQPTPNNEEAFHYQRRIAQLTARAEGMTEDVSSTGTDPRGGDSNKVLVKELFTRPGGKYPKGRYVVVVGTVLVKNTDLPWFRDMKNPFPVEEFTDVPSVGQYWSTTIAEQLVGPQRQYNFIRNKIDQQLRLMMHPKVFIPNQARIAKTAFHSGAGEKIYYNWIPGLPAPFPWTPPNVAADSWRMLQVLREEIDQISQIYPASEGAVGDSKSGVQTNLLQEASDSVHAPDARAHERAIERSAWKIRRLMKLYYDVPRLLSVSGRHKQAEVFEFSSEQIDEEADIVVQAGSSLPFLKAAQQQIFIEWLDKGVFGPLGDPETNRKFLSVVDIPGVDDISTPARKDEELAMLENDMVTSGQPIPVPQFYENHRIHYASHTDELKTPMLQEMDDETRLAFITHILLHLKYINAPAAAQIATEYGLGEQLIGFGVDKIPPPPPVPMPPPEGGQPSNAPSSNEGGDRPPAGEPGSGQAPPAGSPPPIQNSAPQALTRFTQER